MKYHTDLEAGLKRSLTDDARIQSIMNKVVDGVGSKRKSGYNKRFMLLLLGGAMITLLLLFLFPYFDRVNENSQMNLPLSSEGYYAGFEEALTIDSVEDAMAKGYVVELESGIVANPSKWDVFVAQSRKGIHSSVRIAHFYSADLGREVKPLITDVYFIDGFYYVFQNSSDMQNARPYRFLLELEGVFGSPRRSMDAVILTDDKSMTFDDVIQSMISSNSEVIKKTSKYDLIFFTFKSNDE